MKRRNVLKYLSMSAATVGLSQISCNAQSQEKYNVLFLAIDDLRPQLKSYGEAQMLTPNLDKLADRGVLFERAYCQIPVCGASRLSVMTGARPNKSPGEPVGRFWSYHSRLDEPVENWRGNLEPAGINRPKTPEGNPAPTLPMLFKQQGYNTQSVGKIYHVMDDDLDAWNYGMTRFKDIRVYNIPGNERNAYEIGENQPDNAYPDGITRDLAIAALRNLKEQQKPFFLALGFVKPHLPFNCPKKYWDMYDRNTIELAQNPFAPTDAPSESLHDWGELRGYRNLVFSDETQSQLDEEYARTLIHGYYACTTFVDTCIGSVLDELERLGLRDNTIIVVWGDHGFLLGEHNLWAKTTNYELALRVPLIIDVPGKFKPAKTSALVELVDIYPTLCELVGIEPPQHLEGTSLVPLLNNPQRAWKGAVFSRYEYGDTILTDRYNYTEYIDVEDNFLSRMLYDRHLDPLETRNIANLPENAALVETLSELLAIGWKRAAVFGNGNFPIPFDVLPDGTIIVPDSISRSKSSQLFPASPRVSLKAKEIEILNKQATLSMGTQKDLTFQIESGDRFQIARLWLVEKQDPTKNAIRVEMIGNQSIVGRWSSPKPGDYFYQLHLKKSNENYIVKTGTVKLV
ncbi:sulfatase [Laspinema sp. D1]|uniref:Sulfatase n=2 Tax=Laspinema TaxID=2584823 RepID=A0ABT2MTK7_9CYAN|nr:sulfatase [Laspinema sp. D2a]